MGRSVLGKVPMEWSSSLLVKTGNRNFTMYIINSLNFQQAVPCLFYSETNQLNPWSKVLLEKLIVTHLLKKFPKFYGTRRFFTVFTEARHWAPYEARRIQSTSSHPISLKIHSYIILSSTPRSPKWSLSFRFSN
jgi:hypothetical protein